MGAFLFQPQGRPLTLCWEEQWEQPGTVAEMAWSWHPESHCFPLRQSVERECGVGTTVFAEVLQMLCK